MKEVSHCAMPLFLCGAVGKCPGFVLAAAEHRCSFTENRISSKLAGVARSNMPEIFLFSLFISHMFCPAPAESAVGTSQQPRPKNAPSMTSLFYITFYRTTSFYSKGI